MAGELEAQTILDVVPAAQRNRDRWPVEYHTPDVEYFGEGYPVTGGGGLIQGNFYTLNTDEDGNIFLQGGCVIAGANGETVEPFKLMNLPANGDPNWEGDPDDHAIMTIRGNALTSDGVLLPQFNLESAVISINDEIGQTTLPTKANPSGVYRTSLGQFTEGGFVSNRPGNFLVTFCSGSYDVNREG